MYFFIFHIEIAFITVSYVNAWLYTDN